MWGREFFLRTGGFDGRFEGIEDVHLAFKADQLGARAARRDRPKQLYCRRPRRETLEKQLDTLKNQKKELAGAIDALEAEVNLLKLQQMESKYQCDNTRLSSIKESIRDMRKRIDIKREQLKLAPIVHEEKPTTATANRSVDEILAGLGNEAKPATGSKD